MSFAAIQTALDGRFLAMNPPNPQLENTRNQARVGQTWTRATLLPSPTRQLSVGVSGRDIYTGLYQIDFFAPVDSGTAAGRTFADQVSAHFPRGLRLVAGTSNVVIISVSVAPAQRVDATYQQAVSILWNAIF